MAGPSLLNGATRYSTPQPQASSFVTCHHEQLSGYEHRGLARRGLEHPQHATISVSGLHENVGKIHALYLLVIPGGDGGAGICLSMSLVVGRIEDTECQLIYVTLFI